MDRRQFCQASSAALFSALVFGAEQVRAPRPAFAWETWRSRPSGAPDAPDAEPVEPLPAITAAVNVVVPADPDIPGDFRGSDYGADRYVANTLGQSGQSIMASLLDSYADQVCGKGFLACSEEERRSALQEWIRERETAAPLVRELLSGLVALSMIGTFEENTPEEQADLFESMGWFDPEDPTGTLRFPNEGYADSFQFPARRKRGLRP